MTIPSLTYDRIISVLRRTGWEVVRQKGCHIRLQKGSIDGPLALTVPALRPIRRSTLAQIIKEAQLSVEDLERLL